MTVNELKDTFFSVKLNKRPGYDEVSFNAIKKWFGSLHKPLLHISNASLQNGTFPDELEIGRVTRLFKNGSDSDLGNYRPISVLPCFSKIYEKIMYKHLYKHLSDNNILYRKQFGFQEKLSTKHAIMQLVNQINCSFEENLYTLGTFIDLSKAFDSVDHNILITKLENYGVTGTNLQWFKSYLENRKRCIAYKTFLTSYINISCGVPQGSILGPLIFLVCINSIKCLMY